MAVIEPIVAALGLAVCLALLLQMVLPPRQRQRVDAALLRAWHGGRRRWRRGRSDHAKRRHAAQAAQASEQADDAIRRARRAAQQDGNVIRPDAFERPRKPH